METEFICPFCGSSLKLINKFTKSGHLAKCKKFKIYKDEKLTKSYLYEEYILNNRSAIEIAQEHKLESATCIIKLLKKYDIKTRNIKESKNEREKEKRIKTNIQKYNCEHNFCKNHPSRIEWEERLYNEEGIINVFQRQEIVDKITEKKYNAGIIIPRKYKTEELEIYYYDVWHETNKNFNKFYNDINPKNYIRGRKSYHLDHKISIMYGFLNKIDPLIIGHKCNLQMLYYKDNLSKSIKCSLTLEELMRRIYEYENC